MVNLSKAAKRLYYLGLYKEAQKVIDFNERLERKKKEENEEKKMGLFGLQQPRDESSESFDNRTFTATREIEQTWTADELNELLEKHGYNVSLTDQLGDALASSLVWNLENDNDHLSFNDSIRDLLEDVVEKWGTAK